MAARPVGNEPSDLRKTKTVGGGGRHRSSMRRASASGPDDLDFGSQRGRHSQEHVPLHVEDSTGSPNGTMFGSCPGSVIGRWTMELTVVVPNEMLQDPRTKFVTATHSNEKV